jgi:hypothetical protein
MDQLERLTSDPVRERSKEYKPRIVRVDKKNSIWTFQTGKWKVRVKAKFPSVRASRFQVADLQITCSCPFWRWQGPEHWGQTEGYLYQRPRGTATFPKIRDPGHEKPVCKHTYAVLQTLKTLRRITRRKASGLPTFFARVRVSYEGLETIARTIVRRYQKMKGRSDAGL